MLPELPDGEHAARRVGERSPCGRRRGCRTARRTRLPPASAPPPRSRRRRRPRRTSSRPAGSTGRRPRPATSRPRSRQHRVLAARLGLPAEQLRVEAAAAAVGLPACRPSRDAGLITVAFAHVSCRTVSELEKPTTMEFGLTVLNSVDGMMRTYGDRCGIARALDVVGERWALLVVRELLLGPKRFTDLRAGLPKVSPDVLSQRLRELEQAGLLQPPQARAAGARRRSTSSPSAGARSSRSCWSSAAGAASAPFPAGDAAFGADAFVIALKTMFDPAAADGRRRQRTSCGSARTGFRVARGRRRGSRSRAGTAEARRDDRDRPRHARGGALARPAAVRGAADGRRRDRGQHTCGQALPARSSRRRSRWARRTARARRSERGRAPTAGGGRRGRRPADARPPRRCGRRSAR